MSWKGKASFREADARKLIANLAKKEAGAPEKAFPYIRDKIEYSPYQGVIRGAGETLKVVIL